MTMPIRSQMLKMLKYFGFVFITLFIFRLIYGFVSSDTSTQSINLGDYFSSMEGIRKNYASDKVNIEASASQIPISAAKISTQKFEKTATIKSKSSQFDTDEKAVKAKTKSYNALIQYEQNTGNTGEREIHLMIGVNPERFDQFYTDIKKIGNVKSAEITKIDKTNEYRQLNAQKASIEKTLQSLYELKSRGGVISDFVALNEKILEYEERMQNLGVELGNFDEENEFCTVRISLYEGSTTKNVSLMYRIKVALEWTIKYYLFAIVGLLCTVVVAYVLLLIIEKSKILSRISE
jgi:hypothetical protein